MGTEIYYFSGTGNSYVIAKDLQKLLEDAELHSIPACMEHGRVPTEAQAVGLVFPLYFWGVPKVVSDFIEKLELKKDQTIFAVVTRGGKSYQGGALHQADKALKRKGARLNAGFYVQMPDNYIPLLKVPSLKEQQEQFRKAGEKVKRIAASITKGESVVEREVTAWVSPLLTKPFVNRVMKMDTGFRAETDCNSCGLCEKVCRFHNIQMVDGKPQWQHHCQFCLACINYCPKQAIEYKKGTRGKVRYHHPQVPVSDYMKI